MIEHTHVHTTAEIPMPAEPIELNGVTCAPAETFGVGFFKDSPTVDIWLARGGWGVFRPLTPAEARTLAAKLLEFAAQVAGGGA